MQQKLILVGAIVFALIAFVLSGRYMVNQKKKLFAGNKMVKVIVAKDDLNPGTVIDPKSDLAIIDMLERGLTDRVFLYDAASQSNVRLLDGKRISRRVPKRQVITWDDVDIPEFRRNTFADSIGTGMGIGEKDLYRAIAIPVSTETSVAGLVRPNDRVDVIGTYVKPLPDAQDRGDVETVTRTILQNVTVLAVGQEFANANALERSRIKRSGNYSTMTLQVTPREAELLVFIQQAKGKLTMSLRRPSNLDFEPDLPRVDFTHIDDELEKLNEARQQMIQKASRGR